MLFVGRERNFYLLAGTEIGVVAEDDIFSARSFLLECDLALASVYPSTLGVEFLLDLVKLRAASAVCIDQCVKLVLCTCLCAIERVAREQMRDNERPALLARLCTCFIYFCLHTGKIDPRVVTFVAEIQQGTYRACKRVVYLSDALRIFELVGKECHRGI